MAFWIYSHYWMCVRIIVIGKVSISVLNLRRIHSMRLKTCLQQMSDPMTSMVKRRSSPSTSRVTLVRLPSPTLGLWVEIILLPLNKQIKLNIVFVASRLLHVSLYLTIEFYTRHAIQVIEIQYIVSNVRYWRKMKWHKNYKIH